jgi:predicted nucleic acid-binding protein
MKDNYFIDTNILIYLINQNEIEKHNLAKKIVKNTNCNISIQNLKELSNILFKKTPLTPIEISKYIIRIGSFATLLPELTTDILEATKMSKRKNFYDALLVATMKRNGIKKIITENEKDFSDFKGIEIINPFR